MARRAAKVDANQRDIVDALRGVGALVHPTHQLGKGFPDLLVCWHGVLALVEVKDGGKVRSAQRLTDDEVRWHEQWQEAPVYVVNSVEAAMEMLNQVSSERGV